MLQRQHHAGPCGGDGDGGPHLGPSGTHPSQEKLNDLSLGLHRPLALECTLLWYMDLSHSQIGDTGTGLRTEAQLKAEKRASDGG